MTDEICLGRVNPFQDRAFKKRMVRILLTQVFIFVACVVWQVKGQFGYMMPQPVMMAPQPVIMAPQQPMMGMGYNSGGMQQPGMTAGVQRGPWSECSRTCGIDSVKTRTYSPCDTSRSSCTEKEGCMVPECGLTKLFKEGTEVTVPCHSEAGKGDYKAQWFKYEDNDKNWKYVSMVPEHKFMDDKMNLIIAKVSVSDQGTYRCNLQSLQGTIVAESIWHFSVETEVNKEAAGGGGAAVGAVIVIIIIVVCICRCRKKPEDGDGSKAKKASGGESGGYDFGDDFNFDDFGY